MNEVLEQNLKYATKDLLKKAIGVENFYKLIAYLESRNINPTVANIKQACREEENLGKAIVSNGDLLLRYRQVIEKKKSPAASQQKEVNKAMNKPKR